MTKYTNQKGFTTRKPTACRRFSARLSCKPFRMPKAGQESRKWFSGATRRITGFLPTARISRLFATSQGFTPITCAAKSTQRRSAVSFGKTHHCRLLSKSQHQKNVAASQWKSKCACLCASMFAAHRRNRRARGAWAQSQAMFNFT